MTAIPRANRIAHFVFAELEGQQTLGPDRRLGLLIRHELLGAAKFTSLRHAPRRENRNRLTALAFHGNLFGLPATLLVRNTPQGRSQIMLNDLAARLDFCRRYRATIGTNQCLLRRVPPSLRAA